MSKSSRGISKKMSISIARLNASTVFPIFFEMRTARSRGTASSKTNSACVASLFCKSFATILLWKRVRLVFASKQKDLTVVDVFEPVQSLVYICLSDMHVIFLRITQVATHKILDGRRPFSLKEIDAPPDFCSIHFYFPSPQAQSGRLCYKDGNLR